MKKSAIQDALIAFRYGDMQGKLLDFSFPSNGKHDSLLWVDVRGLGLEKRGDQNQIAKSIVRKLG